MNPDSPDLDPAGFGDGVGFSLSLTPVVSEPT